MYDVSQMFSAMFGADLLIITVVLYEIESVMVPQVRMSVYYTFW